MRSRGIVVLSAVVLACLAPAADATHRKPVTKAFQVKGTVPYPVESAMCARSTHGRDRHVETFKAPDAGTLLVEVTDFVGDFDIVIYSDKGAVLVQGNNESGTSGVRPSTGDTVETAKIKLKKGQTVMAHVCNYLASPDAAGKLTFTFAK